MYLENEVIQFTIDGERESWDSLHNVCLSLEGVANVCDALVETNATDDYASKQFEMLGDYMNITRLRLLHILNTVNPYKEAVK